MSTFRSQAATACGFAEEGQSVSDETLLATISGYRRERDALRKQVERLQGGNETTERLRAVGKRVLAILDAAIEVAGDSEVRCSCLGPELCSACKLRAAVKKYREVVTK